MKRINLFDPKVDKTEFVPPVSLAKAELLCQDMEKKLSVWFESKPDAREVFRCGGSVYKQKESEV